MMKVLPDKATNYDPKKFAGINKLKRIPVFQLITSLQTLSFKTQRLCIMSVVQLNLADYVY